MAEPDPSDGLIRLEKLITKDLHTYLDPTNRASVIGWGLFFQVERQIHAVLTLHAAGACSAAIPNQRTALEHAVTLRWCVDQGDRIGDIYNRKLGNDQIQLAKALKADGTKDRYGDAYKIMADTVQTVKETISPDPNERLAKIEHLMKGYGLAKEWSFYQVESRYVHPTLTGAQLFFKDDGEAFHVSQAPIHQEPVPCLLFSLWILHVAMLSFNQMLRDKPWRAELEQIAKEYDLTMTLPKWQGPDDLHAKGVRLPN
ncbi:DUF5677 domain-containing protein [Streptomyces cinerochromogenes]|uniref:DUF5677 domain-containing protein n=1 Tax=Streptomyces cinerochromogenes TaxID=66422 RepID=UPI00167102E9|nr:DUF5677 domain-containing protein [Streptomyces cinerochromogenes]GGS82762.1 hypothetical protein GCM10010206_51670 [Streptomyces cinerochromogenes]